MQFVTILILCAPLLLFIAAMTALASQRRILAAILGLLSRVSWKGVIITPDHCVNCGMCRHACPFGAIQPSTVQKERKP